jgi:hypothetical protein
MFGKSYVINGITFDFWLDKSRWQWRIKDSAKPYRSQEPLLILTKAKGEAVQEFLKLVSEYEKNEKKLKQSEFIVEKPKWDFD